jgi:hypothetical protein
MSGCGVQQFRAGRTDTASNDKTDVTVHKRTGANVT